MIRRPGSLSLAGRRRKAPVLSEWLEAARARVDEALPALLPARHEMAPRVHDAMAGALLSPGKRIRPALVLAVGEIYRVDAARLLPAAGAIEMIHACSLILDDLPCMDNAPLRRGRPACHVAHGEATAILAAIGLLNRAFGILAGEGGAAPGLPARLRTLAAARLAEAIGPDGLIGGQEADLEEGRRSALGTASGDLATLEFIHSHKTGSLFIASAEVGARLSGAAEDEVAALLDYARNLGLAFQITDDLIDATATAEAAGKPVGQDAGRTTFVSLCGVEGARQLAAELCATAVAVLGPFGSRASLLSDLARFVEARDR